MQRVLRKTYNGEQLTLVECFKYLGLELNRLNDMKRVIEELCKQAKRAQTVIDLRLIRHKTVSFQQYSYFYLKIAFESMYPLSFHAIEQTLYGFISKCKFDQNCSNF